MSLNIKSAEAVAGVVPTIAGAPLPDRDQLDRKCRLISLPPLSLQAFSERLDNGLGFAFSGEAGQRFYQAVGLGTLDVQRHVIPQW